MKLSDLKPKSITFEASGVSLTFRPFIIADDLAAEEIMGNYVILQEALERFDFEKLSLLAWYQLDLKSQREVLKAVEGIFIDPETGEEKDAGLKPIDKFRQLFTGIADQKILIESLLNCRGLNLPDLEDAEAVKKWADQIAEILPTSTGQ